MWPAQPVIINTWKMLSTERALNALACALYLEGGKIYKNAFEGSKE